MSQQEADLRDAAVNAAQAAVTALDRLILANSVAEAAQSYRLAVASNGPDKRFALRRLDELYTALDAWVKGQPS